jgi:hypothetical protein
MKENCALAQLVITALRALLPDTEFYLPADHEEFISKAFLCGLISEKEILDIDCQIVGECDGLLALSNGFISNGMDIEIQYAKLRKIPCFTWDIASFVTNLIGWLKDETPKNK